MDILNGPASRKNRVCPDCGSAMESDNTCSECGCGEEDDMEMEDDGEEEDMQGERIAELRDDLQRVVDKMSKLAPDTEEEDSSEDYMLPLPTVFSVRKMMAPKS